MILVVKVVLPLVQVTINISVTSNTTILDAFMNDDEVDIMNVDDDDAGGEGGYNLDEMMLAAEGEIIDHNNGLSQELLELA